MHLQCRYRRLLRVGPACEVDINSELCDVPRSSRRYRRPRSVRIVFLCICNRWAYSAKTLEMILFIATHRRRSISTRGRWCPARRPRSAVIIIMHVTIINRGVARGRPRRLSTNLCVSTALTHVFNSRKLHESAVHCELCSCVTSFLMILCYAVM